jgi:hypothetical protein
MCESKIMYGGELRGLDEAWKETDRILGRFSKKILELRGCAANGIADEELGTDGRRGKAMWLTVKYWQQISIWTFKTLPEAYSVELPRSQKMENAIYE